MSCTRSSAPAPRRARSTREHSQARSCACEIQCIGATTLNEYRKYIEKDAALERRFQPVFVDQPTLAETIDILNGVKSLYEKHHRVTITTPRFALRLC